MKTPNYSFIFLFTLIIAFQSNAQEKSSDSDYIITVNNDTLRGEVSEFNNSSIYFKTSGEQVAKIISSKQIKSYFTYQTKVIVKNINIEGIEVPYFLRELLIGYVSLYELVKSTDSFLYFLELPDKNIVALPKNNTSWAILRSNLLECSNQYFENQMLQKNYTYSESFFKRLIKSYNLCVKPNEQVHEPRNTSHSIFGILLGMGINSWDYTYDMGDNPFYNFNGKLSNDTQFTFGLFYTFNIKKRLSCDLNLMYNQYNGSRNVPVTSFGTALDPYQLLIYEKYLNMPILISYSIFSNQKFKLSGKAGPSFGYDLAFKETKRRDFSSDIVVERSNTVFWGYGLGIGLEKKISSKMNLNVDLKYLNHGVQDKVTYVGSSNSLQLTVGLGFHK